MWTLHARAHPAPAAPGRLKAVRTVRRTSTVKAAAGPALLLVAALALAACADGSRAGSPTAPDARRLDAGARYDYDLSRVPRSAFAPPAAAITRPGGPRAAADVAAAADPGDVVVNGSFEVNGGVGTRVFAGWTVVDLPGGSGSWFVQRGTASPLNNFLVAPPTDGLFAAMTD